MIEFAKKLGIWAGIGIGGTIAGITVAFLVMAGSKYLSPKFDRLDQPLHTYYNTDSTLGNWFYELSQSHSQSEGHTFFIIPGALGEAGLKYILSPEGWDIAESRRYQEDSDLSFPPADIRGVTRHEAVGDGTFCDINMSGFNKASDYLNLFTNKEWVVAYRVFMHEVGHCIHSQYDNHKEMLTGEGALDADMKSMINLSFKDAPVQWTNQMGDSNLTGMHQRYLMEGFAEVYTYAYMTQEAGYSSEAILREQNRNLDPDFNSAGGVARFTAPFLTDAHKNRHRIASFSSPAKFADHIIRTSKFSSDTFFNSVLAAHLVMNKKVDMLEVRDGQRINETVRFIERYLR